MLLPPVHQVAGHVLKERVGQGPLHDARGRFLKPVQAGPRGGREVSFYDHLERLRGCCSPAVASAQSEACNGLQASKGREASGQQAGGREGSACEAIGQQESVIEASELEGRGREASGLELEAGQRMESADASVVVELLPNGKDGNENSGSQKGGCEKDRLADVDGALPPRWGHLPEVIAGFFPRFHGICEVDGIAHMELEDVTFPFSNPCVLDVKMGYMGWYKGCSEKYLEVHRMKAATTTTGTLGFRVSGVKVYSLREQASWVRSQGWCKGITDESIRAVLLRFLAGIPRPCGPACNRRQQGPGDAGGLRDGSRAGPDIGRVDLQEELHWDAVSPAHLASLPLYGHPRVARVLDGASGLLAQMEALEKWFETQTGYHFFSVSLLLVYEGERAQEFCYCIPSSEQRPAQGGAEEGEGLWAPNAGTIVMESDITCGVDRPVATPGGLLVDGSVQERFLLSCEMDRVGNRSGAACEESLSGACGHGAANSAVGGTGACTKVVDSAAVMTDSDHSEKDYRPRLYLIDFAHVMDAEGSVDENFLGGLRSFKTILSGLLSEIKQAMRPV
eukprot:jgi/Mesvir1/5718/Mv09821-RA.1